MLVSALLGALVGAILGLTGAGGGILAVPALTFGMHWSMQQAAPVALIAVALGAAVGAVDGLRKGLVRYRGAAVIALSSFPLVYLGQAIALRLSQPVLQLGFAGIMLLVAYRMHSRAEPSEGAASEPAKFAAESGIFSGASTMARVHADSGKFIWTLPTAVLLASIGGFTGLMTGLLGVGGGFVIVPLLRKFTNVPMSGIVATSLMVIALVSASGVASALIRHTPVAWGATAIFSATTVVGMLMGRRYVQAIAPQRVLTTFSWVLALVSLGLLGRALLTLADPALRFF